MPTFKSALEAWLGCAKVYCLHHLALTSGQPPQPSGHRTCTRCGMSSTTQRCQGALSPLPLSLQAHHDGCDSWVGGFAPALAGYARSEAASHCRVSVGDPLTRLIELGCARCLACYYEVRCTSQMVSLRMLRAKARGCPGCVRRQTEAACGLRSNLRQSMGGRPRHCAWTSLRDGSDRDSPATTRTNAHPLGRSTRRTVGTTADEQRAPPGAVAVCVCVCRTAQGATAHTVPGASTPGGANRRGDSSECSDWLLVPRWQHQPRDTPSARQHSARTERGPWTRAPALADANALVGSR